MRRIVITSIFLLLACVAVHAQKNNEPQITRKYDRFKDVTNITLRPYTILNFKGGSSLSIFAFAQIKGTKATSTPERVGFGLRIDVGKGYEIDLKNTELLAIADGQRYDFGELEVIQLDDYPNTKRAISYATTASPNDLFMLSSIGSQNVEMRFGDTEFKLSAGGRSALLSFCTELMEESKQPK